MDHREALSVFGRKNEILFSYYSAFRYYLFFCLNIIFQFYEKNSLHLLHLSSTINSRNSESELLFIYLFIYFFPPLCKTKNAGPVPFPAFVGSKLSHDRSFNVSHRYKSTGTNRHHPTLSPKTVTQVIVTHVMYDIIMCIHIYIYI